MTHSQATRSVVLVLLMMWNLRLLSEEYQVPTCQEVATIPQGVADLRSGTAYVSIGEATEALKLDTGATLWVHPGARWPLWKHGNSLIVLSRSSTGESLFVQFLDGRDGVRQPTSEPLRVPESDVRSLLQSRQRPDVQIQGDNLYLRWRRTARYQGGANPPLDARVLAENSGVARIDLNSGTSELVDQFPADSSPKYRKSPCTVPSFRECHELCAPWTVERATIEVVREGDRFALKLSYPGVASSRVVILGPTQNTHPYVTADGKYILVQQQGKESVKTVVYSAFSGSEAGQIPGEFSLSDAKVFGSTLFYLSTKPGESELSLRAVRLPDGKLLWYRNIRVPLPDVGSKMPG